MDNGYVTARIPVSPPVVRALVKRLMLWLHANGHTQVRSVQQFLTTYAKSTDRHPRRSQAGIVIATLHAAFAALTVINRPARVRAITKLHVARSHVMGLHDELVTLDKQNAREVFDATDPGFAELGSNLLQALEAVADKLEIARGVDPPNSTASWTAFIGSFTRDLRKAGMTTEDAAKLVEGATRSTKVASLRRQNARLAARSQQEGERTKK